MADSKKKVNPRKNVEGEEAVQHMAISPVPSHNQSQQPVYRSAVEPARFKVQANAVSLA